MTAVDVVVTYLELDLAASHASGPPSPGHAESIFELERAPAPDAAVIAAAMYRAVGGPWLWTGRLGWADAEWDAAVNREGVELWVARVEGKLAGYFELHVEGDAIELKYFGLVPEFTGRRIGGGFLTAAVQRARELGTSRMTVNTCTLDHPGALPNYLKRGFVVVRTELEHRTMS